MYKEFESSLTKIFHRCWKTVVHSAFTQRSKSSKSMTFRFSGDLRSTQGSAVL